jgi:predicted N-acyltransferase
MLDELKSTTVNVLNSINDVEAIDWDSCAGTQQPFCRHGFLSALEDSGSASADSGWLSHHLVIRNEKDDLVACSPLYLKNHSYGEYVFDWSWADAFNRAGGNYYPKLQCAVPFTPVTGNRLLVRDDLSDASKEKLKKILAVTMLKLGEKLGVSSIHVTFPTENEWLELGKVGMLLRIGQQFHWKNKNYKDFDDFLADLTSRKRKSIRKERNSIANHSLKFRWLSGINITEDIWDTFYQFYLDTIEKKWGQNYLNREFFSLLGERLGDSIVLVIAENAGQPVAGALNFLGNDTLYGRNWGCNSEYKFLHFEVCYYQAIEYAIQHKLKWVEAGAQGAHKVQRGYLPQITYSAHWIANSSFQDAISHFLDKERLNVKQEIEYLNNHTPFRKTD